MVVDSSALLAIARDEPEARPFSDALLRTVDPVLSNVALVECSIALTRLLGDDGQTLLDRLVQGLRLRRVCVDDEIADLARESCRSFCAGTSPALLDAGGCVSYALARALDRPLLFKEVTSCEQTLRSPVERREESPDNWRSHLGRCSA